MEMLTIKRTYKRENKNGLFENYFAEKGLFCWYISCFNKEIKNITVRKYEDDKEEDYEEKTIPELPTEVAYEYVKLSYSLNNPTH